MYFRLGAALVLSVIEVCLKRAKIERRASVIFPTVSQPEAIVGNGPIRSGKVPPAAGSEGFDIKIHIVLTQIL